MPLLADVAVIGGGPAGSAAARLLASWGHSVVLASRPARQPALAESLPPSCTKLFDEIGVRAAIDRAGLHPRDGKHGAVGGPRAARRDVRPCVARISGAARPVRRAAARRRASGRRGDRARGVGARRGTRRRTCGALRFDRPTGARHRARTVGPRLQRTSRRDRVAAGDAPSRAARTIAVAARVGPRRTPGRSRTKRTRSSRATPTDGRGRFRCRRSGGSSP